MRPRPYILILSLLFCMGVCYKVKAQRELHLTQYNMHQPYLNPASISSYQDISAALLYKKQWVGFKGAPTFQGVDFNMPIGDTKSSIGLTAFNDGRGIGRTTDIGINYAYKLQVSDGSYLSFGLTGSLVMMKDNYNKLELYDQQDPRFAGSGPNMMSPDFRFGSYYFQDRFYIGFATPNILKNRITGEEGNYSTSTEFDPSAIHYFLHSGYEFKLAEEWKLQPSTMFKFVSGSPVQVDLNAQVLYKDRYGIGLGYRNSKILNAFFNIRFARNFRLGYAYDYNFSALKTSSSGSHEVMVTYVRDLKMEDVKMNVPRF
ncbi:MAG: type IX secretion system membrane protein PorP/SprF [Flavobacteriales bacterium]